MKNFFIVLFTVLGLLSLNAQTARLQVIHNAADPIAAVVDVYVNGSLALDDFAFRTATPFIDIPANTAIDIGIAPGSSTSAADTIKNFEVIFEPNKKYVAIANGVIDPSQFASNPDNIPISFTLFAIDYAREQGTFFRLVDFATLHGATDAPSVDIFVKLNYAESKSVSDEIAKETGIEGLIPGDRVKIINDLGYGNITEYKKLFPTQYILEVTPADDNNIVVASFDVNLTGLGGGAAVVFASGFLDPSANQNGAAFGLFAALPNGTVVEFPAIVPVITTRLQVIHNAADPAANEVDIYVNGALLLDDFAFRTATPFIDVPPNVALDIGVAPANSTSAADTIKNFVVTFEEGKTYVAIANGVLNPADFSPNPDGKDIAFTLFVNDNARETSGNPFKVDLFAVHGSTDAPTVNIASLFGLRIPNVAYGDISGYFSLPAFKNWIAVYTTNPFTLVGVYSADLRGLGGNAAVVFASGFVNPNANQNGALFGLYAALPNGAVAQLPKVFGLDEANTLEKILGENGDANLVNEFRLDQNYPNPFNPSTSIKFNIPEKDFVTLKVYDVLGNEMATLVNGIKEAGNYEVNFDAGQLATGVYIYKLQSGNLVDTRKMILLK
jgi:hypothetical protein